MDEAIRIAKRVRAKWQRIVNAPTTTQIGGACAAGSVRSADEIVIALIKARLVRELKRADAAPPEAEFDNFADMMKWLDEPALVPNVLPPHEGTK